MTGQRRAARLQDDDASPHATVRQIMGDLDQSEADLAAGRTDDGRALLATMGRTVEDLKAKTTRARRA